MVNWESKLSDYARRVEPSAIFALLDMPRAPDTINLGPGEPDPALFPVGRIAQIIANELTDSGRARTALQYTVNAGLPPLRERLSALHRSRGLPSSKDNVLVTSGSQQAIDLVVSAFVQPGSRVAVQSPTYPGAMGILKAHGAAIVTLDDAFREAPREFAVIYVTPTFSNPSGETLDIAMRRRVLDLARGSGAILLEDDPYEAISFEDATPSTIQSLDAKNGIEQSQTLYTSTFSKSLTPGFRVGWLHGPSSIIRKLTLLKQSEDMQAGTLSQLVAAEAMQFVYSEHVPRLREEYRRRRDAMLGALERHFGGQAKWTRPAGGFFVWMTLPEHVDAVALLRVAALQGVTFVPGTACSHRGEYKNCLRLSYSTNPAATLEEAICRLGSAFRSFQKLTAGSR
jgi:DNA-binding transcriptional MocR family regulator